MIDSFPQLPQSLLSLILGKTKTLFMTLSEFHCPTAREISVGTWILLASVTPWLKGAEEGSWVLITLCLETKGKIAVEEVFLALIPLGREIPVLDPITTTLLHRLVEDRTPPTEEAVMGDQATHRLAFSSKVSIFHSSTSK